MAKNRYRNNWRKFNSDSATNNNQSSKQITLPPLPSSPPDYIYKFRKNRTLPQRQVWDGGSVSYYPVKIDYVEGRGNFVYYYGLDIPSKCVAPDDHIYATHPVKRKFINLIRLFSSRECLIPILSLLFIGKKRRNALINKVLTYFNDEADMTLTPYYLEDGYYCNTVKEVRVFLENFLISLGVNLETAIKSSEIIGVLFEYDNAYRFRLMDVLAEASKDDLINSFPKEVQRLLELELSRENTGDNGELGVRQKFKNAARILKYGWKVPFFKKAIRAALERVNFDNLKLDEMDIFHTLLYADYNVRGNNLEKRIGIYKEKFGEDINKWPVRIMIKNT